MAEVEFQEEPPFVPAEVPKPRGALSSLAPLLLSLLGPLGLIGGAALTGANLGGRRRSLISEAITEESNVAQLGAPEALQDPNVLIAAGTRLQQRSSTAAQGAALIKQGQSILTRQRQARQDRQAVINADRTFMREARQGIVDDLRPITSQLRADAGQLLGIMNAPQTIAGDQQVIYSFIRLITGGGGQSISDRDVARLSGSPAISNQLTLLFDKYLSGRGLTATDRNDLQGAAVNAYVQNRDLSFGEVQLFRNTAKRLGIPENELFNPDIFIPDERLAALRAPQQALAGDERRKEAGIPAPVRAPLSPTAPAGTITLQELREGVLPGG